MPIKDYLEEVFEEEINIEFYEEAKKLPLFLNNEYEFYKCRVHGNDCILLKLKSERILIDKIQKHFVKFKEYGNEKLVLIFDDLRSNQRRKLVSARIPFIVPNRQIYLPFICLDFSEKVNLVLPEAIKFNATSQSVFLYLLNSKDLEVHTKLVSEQLGIAYATANRAIRQMVTAGLIKESGVATRKQYHRIGKKQLWENGKHFLMNPVQQILYLKELPKDLEVYFTEDSALSKKTMLSEPRNPVYAINKKNAVLIDKKIMLNEYELDGVSFYIIEVWKYDPGIFADSDVVDVFSLFALYTESEDPRIGIEFDELLEEALCED